MTKTKNKKNTTSPSITASKAWWQNPDQKKTPKIFSFQAIRNTDGSFQMIGDQTNMLRRINQFKSEWVPVDTAALTDELSSNKIYFDWSLLGKHLLVWM